MGGNAHGDHDHHDEKSGNGPLLVGLIALIVAGAAWAGGRMTADKPVVVPPVAGVSATEVSVPTTGASDPVIVVIEASDFQCPFCVRVQPQMRRILNDYSDFVQVQFRHNPLPFHPMARPAAKASIAAQLQGKFWEMHDLLYINQKELSRERFVELAGELGLDVARFERDMDSPAAEERVRQDLAAMSALGANGTPNFFINGKQVKGAQTFDVFKDIIDQELMLARKLDDKGLSNAAIYVQLVRGNHPEAEKFIRYAILDEAAPMTGSGPAGDDPHAQRDDGKIAEETVYKVTIDEDDAQKGLPDALVTLVIFSDFECPFCTRLVPTMAEIEKKYGAKVRLVFKHSPLDFHKKARLASQAAIAAQEQGKFWEMHDKLFANQQNLDRADLDRYAKELGLDTVKWKAALDTNAYEARIDADMAQGEKVTVRGTPNVFVNGRKVSGSRPVADFEKLIDEELAKAEKLVAAGTPRTGVYEAIVSKGQVVTLLDADTKRIGKDSAATLGAADAPVTVAVFSDFQCPYCSRVGEPLEQLAKESGGKVNVIFKHFPLPFHDNAVIAAEAAEAAGEQGKFWEMHDKLFANQRALGRADLERYATELGLDMEKFKAALDTHRFEQKVKDNVAEGQTIGVRGTPSVYINGRAFQPTGGYSVASFKKAIDSLAN